MKDKRDVWVLRLGHRIKRDKRISTHCALVARALGARGIYYSGQKDASFEGSVKNVVKNWGGSFQVKYEKSWKKLLEAWPGKTAHLTVYGISLEEKMPQIRKSRKPLLVVIGGEKVPGDVYKLVDFNVSVTQQPHSEVSSLCYFLHSYFRGEELKKKFKGAKLRIIPQERGKKVIKVS